MNELDPKGNLKPNQFTNDPYEQREIAAENGYYEDPRWPEVNRLRNEGKVAEGNGLYSSIQMDWGVD